MLITSTEDAGTGYFGLDTFDFLSDGNGIQLLVYATAKHPENKQPFIC